MSSEKPLAQSFALVKKQFPDAPSYLSVQKLNQWASYMKGKAQFEKWFEQSKKIVEKFPANEYATALYLALGRFAPVPPRPPQPEEEKDPNKLEESKDFERSEDFDKYLDQQEDKAIANIPQGKFQLKPAFRMQNKMLSQTLKSKGGFLYPGEEALTALKQLRKPQKMGGIRTKAGRETMAQKMEGIIYSSKKQNQKLLEGQKNYISLFPQWAANAKKEVEKFSTLQGFLDQFQKIGKDYNSLTEAQKASRLYVDKQGKIEPNKTLVESRKAWGRIQNKIKTSQKIGKKFEHSKYLASLRATDEQVDTQLPLIVKQIITDNQKVSKYGIGPISQNSLSLYVGRWVDPVTGAMRILPTATTKYLNYFSFPQRIAYHQARILNLWNTIVNQQQSYIKLQQMGEQKFIQMQKNKNIDLAEIQENEKADWEGIVQLYSKYVYHPLTLGDVDKFLMEMLGAAQVKLIKDNSTDYRANLSALEQFWISELAAMQIYSMRSKYMTQSITFLTKCMKHVSTLCRSYAHKLKKAITHELIARINTNLSQQDQIKIREGVESFNQVINDQPEYGNSPQDIRIKYADVVSSIPEKVSNVKQIQDLTQKISKKKPIGMKIKSTALPQKEIKQKMSKVMGYGLRTNPRRRQLVNQMESDQPYLKGELYDKILAAIVTK